MTHLGKISAAVDFAAAGEILARTNGLRLSGANEFVIAQQMLDARTQLVQGLVAFPQTLEKIHAIYAGVADASLDFNDYLFLRKKESEDDAPHKRAALAAQLAGLIHDVITNREKLPTDDARQQIISTIIDVVRLKDSVLYDLADGVAFDDQSEFSDIIKDIKKNRRALDRAKNTLFMSQDTLLPRLSYTYIKSGFDGDDLKQEAGIGLMRGIEGFDPHRGFRLYTYACPWVEAALSDFVHKQGSDIYLPMNMKKAQAKMLRLESNFRQTCGRSPSFVELAKAMDMPVDKIHDLQSIDARVVSLDSPVGKGEDSDAVLGDYLPDTSLPDAMEGLINAQIYARLRDTVDSSLSEKHSDIVRKRFGLSGEETQTLEVLAVKYGITRERIRQLEAKALTVLGKHAAEFGERRVEAAAPARKARRKMEPRVKPPMGAGL